MSKERKDVLVAWAYPLLLVPNWAFLKVFMTIVEKKKYQCRRLLHPLLLPPPHNELVSEFPVKSKHGVLFIVSFKE